MPAVAAVRYEGAGDAAPNSVALELLQSSSLEAIVLCPSNPWLSIGPVLAIPELKSALERCRAPIVAVSPVRAEQSFKGPTAKLMRELGLEISAASIARHYAGLIDGIVIDEQDDALAGAIQIPAAREHIFMETLADREELARAVLRFVAALRHGKSVRRAS
jgi:LPPG:FO 2-phospho-L-lactate transferase